MILVSLVLFASFKDNKIEKSESLSRFRFPLVRRCYYSPSYNEQPANVLHKYDKYRISCDDGRNANYGGEISVNQNWKIIFIHINMILDYMQHGPSRGVGDSKD